MPQLTSSIARTDKTLPSGGQIEKFRGPKMYSETRAAEGQSISQKNEWHSYWGLFIKAEDSLSLFLGAHLSRNLIKKAFAKEKKPRPFIKSRSIFLVLQARPGQTMKKLIKRLSMQIAEGKNDRVAHENEPGNKFDTLQLLKDCQTMLQTGAFLQRLTFFLSFTTKTGVFRNKKVPLRREKTSESKTFFHVSSVTDKKGRKETMAR